MSNCTARQLQLNAINYKGSLRVLPVAIGRLCFSLIVCVSDSWTVGAVVTCGKGELGMLVAARCPVVRRQPGIWRGPKYMLGFESGTWTVLLCNQ